MNFSAEYAVAGRTSAPVGWSHPSSSTETHELIFCTSGALYMGLGFERFVIRAGESCILPASTRRYGYRECTQETKFYWAHFKGELGTLPTHSTPNVDRTSRLFDDLIMYSRTPEYDDDACTCALKLVLYEIARAGAVSEDAPYAKLFAICEWIGENCTRQIRVSDVAEHFNYNEDYITRMFKVHYSAGIKSYIDTARLKKIRELLLSTDKKIKDIAEECGFDDSKSFQKFFKYHEGMSALSFRELYFGSGGRKKQED